METGIHDQWIGNQNNATRPKYVHILDEHDTLAATTTKPTKHVTHPHPSFHWSKGQCVSTAGVFLLFFLFLIALIRWRVKTGQEKKIRGRFSLNRIDDNQIHPMPLSQSSSLDDFTSAASIVTSPLDIRHENNIVTSSRLRHWPISSSGDYDVTTDTQECRQHDDVDVMDPRGQRDTLMSPTVTEMNLTIPEDTNGSDTAMYGSIDVTVSHLSTPEPGRPTCDDGGDTSIPLVSSNDLQYNPSINESNTSKTTSMISYIRHYVDTIKDNWLSPVFSIWKNRNETTVDASCDIPLNRDSDGIGDDNNENGGNISCGAEATPSHSEETCQISFAIVEDVDSNSGTYHSACEDVLDSSNAPNDVVSDMDTMLERGRGVCVNDNVGPESMAGNSQRFSSVPETSSHRGECTSGSTSWREVRIDGTSQSVQNRHCQQTQTAQPLQSTPIFHTSTTISSAFSSNSQQVMSPRLSSSSFLPCHCHSSNHQSPLHSNSRHVSSHIRRLHSTSTDAAASTNQNAGTRTSHGSSRHHICPLHQALSSPLETFQLQPVQTPIGAGIVMQQMSDGSRLVLIPPPKLPEYSERAATPPPPPYQ